MQPSDLPDMPGYGLDVSEDAGAKGASAAPARTAPAGQPQDDGTPVATNDSVQQQAIVDSLGNMLAKKWMAWADIRRPIEEDWLKDLRAYCGQYEQEVLAQIKGGTELFVNITRVKAEAAYARLVDLYTQTKDEPWGIEPTSEPELGPEETQGILQGLKSMNHPVTDDAIEGATKKYALDRSKKMHDRIQDQLDESDWLTFFKSALKELCILGNGVMNGAFIKNKTTCSWTRGAEGWEIAEMSEIVPGCGWTSLWDFYPDPYATSVANADGVFERMVINADQLTRLGALPGFNTDIISGVLSRNPNGNYVPLWHETDRRTLAGFTTTTAGNGRYEVLVYWGRVSGQDLSAAGVEVKNMAAQYQANVWVLDNQCIRAMVNPLNPKRIPYQMAAYEQIPGQLWGIGPPRQMRDSQIMLNAVSRSMSDNVAFSSRPQIEINDDLVAPGANGDEIEPGKLWHRSGGDPQYPLIRVYQIPSNVGELQLLQSNFRQYCDEETSLPSYTHGEQMPGLNKTATGISMLMNAANVVLKTVVKNVDDYLIEPLIKSFYDWNMEYSDDETIKGDMCVVARGSTALIAKEMQSQRLQALLALITADPRGAAIADIAYLYRALADSMDIDGEQAFPENKVEAYEQGTSPGGAQPDGAPGIPGGAPVPPGAGGPVPPAMPGQGSAPAQGPQPGAVQPVAPA
jgi:hypothetical protein